MAVDPGAFTATLARKLIPHNPKQKILALVGSINPNTRIQMEKLWLSQRPIANVLVDARRLIDDESEREIARVTNDALELSRTNTIITITTNGIYPENIIDFRPYSGSPEYLTGRINASLAEIGVNVLRACPSFKGVYSCGGEITQSLCERLGASGLELHDEVMPLAAYGTFYGGDFDGLHVVSKSGIQGDSDAVNLCVNYLKSKLFI